MCVQFKSGTGVLQSSQYQKIQVFEINLTHRPWRRSFLEIARHGRFSNKAVFIKLAGQSIINLCGRNVFTIVNKLIIDQLCIFHQKRSLPLPKRMMFYTLCKRLSTPFPLVQQNHWADFFEMKVKKCVFSNTTDVKTNCIAFAMGPLQSISHYCYTLHCDSEFWLLIRALII